MPKKKKKAGTKKRKTTPADVIAWDKYPRLFFLRGYLFLSYNN